MRTEIHPLPGATPGLRHELTVLHFGTPGARPKATLQAALHADEVPALLVAQALRRQLQVLEEAGALIGEVQLLAVANPIGLSQRLLGRHEGRFDLRDGGNFNRGHADLSESAARALQGQLGHDAEANILAARQALRTAAQALPAQSPTEHLKRLLLITAVDSDVVLDLHCDSQAAMHVYALDVHETQALELGALLGAKAVLLAADSGDGPFDEACSRPWVQLQQRFADHPLPPACFAPTVELRGECDTDLAQAEADARALIEFLRRRGIVAGTPAALPAPSCEATPLAGSEPLTAPHAGVLVFHAEPGQAVAAGDTVATLVNLDSGAHTPLVCRSAGVLYARIATRWAVAGQRVAKIAGRSLQRSGKLLSA
ncbi:MAG: succinylglutamate desuccinylase/aspartoacylase family protein [Rubrivivax sp.]|nr:succinylglutamate desuccinylase/aspartoacylase family protein [Rubrivivax sp.]